LEGRGKVFIRRIYRLSMENGIIPILVWDCTIHYGEE
jgi:hypothetical protein